MQNDLLNTKYTVSRVTSLETLVPTSFVFNESISSGVVI